MSVEIPFEVMGEVRKEALVLYSKASGDPNEIHLNDEVAKKMGLPSVIAHGMLIAAWAGERAIEASKSFPNSKLRSFSTRFQAMTFPGDVIEVGGKAKEDGAGGWKMELQARKKGSSEIVLSASVHFVS